MQLIKTRHFFLCVVTVSESFWYVGLRPETESALKQTSSMCLLV